MYFLKALTNSTKTKIHLEKRFGNGSLKAVGHSFQKIYYIAWYQYQCRIDGLTHPLQGASKKNWQGNVSCRPILVVLYCLRCMRACVPACLCVFVCVSVYVCGVFFIHLVSNLWSLKSDVPPHGR